MPNRRAAIEMDRDEVLAFLDEERIVTVATHGPRDFPHLMPLWYVVREGTVWAWTFGKSQKVLNLQRDPRCTLQVEAGRDRYDQLRGVMLECEARLHDDLDLKVGLGADLARRYGGVEPEGPALDALRAQAPKRIAIEFHETRRASWDHRKL
jgi:nitroimidazol reductase NimA-like FMN-containing flavoprotein (pyridoxamine 5'-phosphate oxidase superfamily)